LRKEKEIRKEKRFKIFLVKYYFISDNTPNVSNMKARSKAMLEALFSESKEE